MAEWVECSPMVWETGVQSQVKSYQKLKKWYLMPPCLTPSIIRYGSRVKWSNQGKGVAPSTTPWCNSYWKGTVGSPSTTVTNLKMVSVHHIFWYNPVSLKNDKTSSILTFANRSLKLFSFMRAKALHSMRTCLTAQGVWYVKHCGCCSCFSMKECVSLVWSMRSRDIMTRRSLWFSES